MDQQLTVIGPKRPALVLPTLIEAADERVRFAYLEFFTATIANPNTRRAYRRDVADFLAWCAAQGATSLAAIRSPTVAAYVETLRRQVRPNGKPLSAPTIKRQLAAIRSLFDHLVTTGAVAFNPAAAVRGPKHFVKKGKTEILEAEETRQLLDAIDTTSLAGLRDRALIAVMVYTFARVGAATGLRVEDVRERRHRLWLCLHEKGGKPHDMPCHHALETYLREWLERSGLAKQPTAFLFPTIMTGTGRGRQQLTTRPIAQAEVHAMIRRRARRAGITAPIGNHTFRGTGITAYLMNGGTLERAREMANHADMRTTKLYDRRSEAIDLGDVERIRI